MPTTTIEGVQVEIAPLDTITFSRLLSKDPPEILKLLRSSQTPGFFYLDLQGQKILEDLRGVLEVTEKYFDQSQDAKMRDFRETQELGYKPGADESFEASIEILLIARTELIQRDFALPAILSDDVLKRFAFASHGITCTMLSCLSDALDSRLETKHRDDEPSPTALKLVFEPTQEKLADVIENKHTDGGTLTLLFSEQWGLQMEFPETKQWGFVAPRAGHAIVNVADSLQSQSAGALHSCLHRVTQFADGYKKRYYIVYLFRPNTVSCEGRMVG